MFLLIIGICAGEVSPPPCWDAPECFRLKEGESGFQVAGAMRPPKGVTPLIADTYWGLPAFYVRDHLVGREKWDLRGVPLRVYETFATLPVRTAASPYLLFFKPTFCGFDFKCPPLLQTLIRNRTDIIWVGHDLTGMILAYPDHVLPGITIPGELGSTLYHAWRYRGQRTFPHRNFLTFQGKCPSKHHAFEWYANYSVRGELNRLFNKVNKQNYGNEPRDLPPGVHYRCIQPNRGRFSNVSQYDNLLDTVFALVPRGDERWSFRFLEAVGAGAIPVIVADGLTLPFENIIDWDSLVVRIPESTVVLADSFNDILSLLPDDDRYARLLEMNDRYLKDGDVIKNTFRQSLHKYVNSKQRFDHVFIDYDTYNPPQQATPRYGMVHQHAAILVDTPPHQTPLFPPATDPPRVIPTSDDKSWIIEILLLWYAPFLALGFFVICLQMRRRTHTVRSTW